MKNLLLTILFLGIAITVFTQSKKDVEKHKIKSRTEITSKVENGETIVKKEFTQFDAAGNCLEESVWINNKLDKKETFVYNKNNLLIEKSVFDKAGSVKKKITYKYNIKNNLTEEITFDAYGKIKKKELIVYNNFDEKETEEIFDGNLNSIEKSFFKYNNKGLKTEKLTYDGNNRLISKKEYQYSF